ncbi:major facilitator superfamily MFS_1 [Segniliparus rotundus DSM 44985]|uniref:Major facilitator superfamily MFS_1 n=1 Tax=Segniliparus rotundus (strain ATCC BAA-972 / CDC 1076 / CIP 108378 / DSM 44985 / JCM 13578) TaxID=640132 RepID=D6Z9Q9_SEGRD|nr:MFS transporter [Segniliparus rotundus]ADG96586.1 major facilitator superfamily MFS_1 [Segniliparus rotundus DSM 44985]
MTAVASARTVRGLDGLVFFLADVQSGLGPFLAVYLASRGWDEQRVGIALTVGGLAAIVFQAPAGALVDRLRAKRALTAAAVAALACAALAVAFVPRFWPVLGAQAVIGAAGTVFGPMMCALALGVVGPAGFDRRQGRNQSLNSAGNVFAAVSMGLLGYYVSNRSVFFFAAACAVPVFLSLRAIRAEEIDHAAARGSAPSASGSGGSRGMFSDWRLGVFLVCAVMFHFANAAMLPLLGERLAKGQGASSMMFMSACVITTQLVIACIAAPVGALAGSWGRKPLLLVAFAVLPVRGVLYTLTDSTVSLVAIQVLDGIGAGVFGVVSVLVIADLTKGTGRFNLVLGLMSTAVAVGASLSQTVAGSIAHHGGFDAAMLSLAGIAAAAFLLLAVRMPETRTSG